MKVYSKDDASKNWALQYWLTDEEQNVIDLLLLKLKGKYGIKDQNDVIALLINRYMNFMLECLLLSGEEGVKNAC